MTAEQAKELIELGYALNYQLAVFGGIFGFCAGVWLVGQWNSR